LFFNRIKNIFHFFIFSNLFVALCALALFLSSEIILETNNLGLSVFVFSSTVFTYNFQRIVRIRRGVSHTRKRWLKKNKQPIIFLISFFSILSFYYFWTFNFNTKITIVLCGIISLLYPFGLRKTPFLKLFLISFIWATATFLLLILESNIVFDGTNFVHFLTRFLFICAITIPFDIRDLKFDHKKLKTLPIVFGENKARVNTNYYIFISISTQHYQAEFSFFNSNFLFNNRSIYFQFNKTEK
jgi:4-hydroxybenzoate polyprenyltransferase